MIGARNATKLGARQLERCGFEFTKELTDLAFEKLMANLRRYGNTPNDALQTALYRVLQTYTRMVCRELTGRIAIPLPTGAGKTQSIVAWLSAVHERFGTSADGNIGVAVCASQVEALCDLKRDLMAEGVPEDCIGLYHSYRFDPQMAEKYLEYGVQLRKGYASLPATNEHEERPILLITHNRVRGKGGIDTFNLFRARPRDLLIWDESLIAADARSVSFLELQSGVGYLRPRAKGEGKLKEVLSYLEGCIDILEWELQRQRYHGGKPERVRLPELTVDQVEAYKAALSSSTVRYHFVLDDLKQLLNMSQAPLRVMDIQGNGGMVTYEITVPDELDNIVILDASHNIRELVSLDGMIREIDVGSDLLSYENVTVHQLRHYSGRNTMTKAFLAKRENRKVSREIAEVIKGIAESEAILIFTFKERFYPRRIDFVNILKGDLEAHGIDLDARVQVPVWRDGKWQTVEKPRIIFLTWGHETSYSKYSYCSHVIFAGVLHRSELDIAAAIAGQRRNLLAPVSNRQVRSVIDSEITHCLYQGMSRGSCRIVEGSKTREMHAWLIHYDLHIREYLEKVMPGVRWERWMAKYLIRESKVQEIASQINDLLLTLPESVRKVSTSEIKKRLILQEDHLTGRRTAGRRDHTTTNRGGHRAGHSAVRRAGHRTTFSKALHVLRQDLPYWREVWEYKGRSFHRLTDHPQGKPQ